MIKDPDSLLREVEISHEERQMIMDSLDDMIILTDDEGRIKSVNRATSEFTGRNCDDVIGRAWEEVIHESGLEAVSMRSDTTELYHAALNKWFSLNAHPFEDGRLNFSGNIITLSDSTEIKQMTDKLERSNRKIAENRNKLKKALERITGVMKDISSQRGPASSGINAPGVTAPDPISQLGEQFDSMRRMLEEKNRALESAKSAIKCANDKIVRQWKMASMGRITAGIAHELNNPLNALASSLKRIGTFFDSLIGTGGRDSMSTARGAAPAAQEIPENVSGIEDIIQESIHITEKVQRILDTFNDIICVDKEAVIPADINDCMESALHIVRGELNYKATVRREYTQVPRTECSPHQLKLVFMNILINAAQAIKKDGNIRIKTWIDNGVISVSVSDSGCGIKHGDLNRVFEPFFTTKSDGTGLGLHISRDIVNKHNGIISVDSRVNEGTTVTIEIPVVNDTQKR